MDIGVIEELGLTKKEVKIYIALLDKNINTVGQVVNETKISRRGCYDIIKKLIDLGLVNYSIKNEERQYFSTNPKRLLEIAEERKEMIKSIMPQLSLMYNSKKDKDETIVKIYEGKEGIKTVMRHQIKAKKTLYVYSNKAEIFEFLKYFMPQHLMAKRRERIKTNIIFDSTICGKNKLNLPLTSIKYLPEEFCSSLNFCVYG
ncbi:MAG: hypothetical protein KAQ92_05695, partial [Candidatus Aenigmarchaeota archaeon]|nr:hypothetical protein [Candidatus Aenigmarchaeota archaeon]